VARLSSRRRRPKVERVRRADPLQFFLRRLYPPAVIFGLPPRGVHVVERIEMDCGD
jgi:hypothetical protein